MAHSRKLSSLPIGFLWTAAAGSGAVSVLNSRSVYVYLRGTTTLATVYQDAACTIPYTNQPLQTNADNTPGGIPGYVFSGTAVDFVDVVSGLRVQADPIAIEDLVGVDGKIGGPGTIGLTTSSNIPLNITPPFLS